MNKVLFDFQSIQSSDFPRKIFISHVIFLKKFSVLYGKDFDVHVLLNDRVSNNNDIAFFISSFLGFDNIHFLSCEVNFEIKEGADYLIPASELIKDEFVSLISPDVFVSFGYFDFLNGYSVSNLQKNVGLNVVVYNSSLSLRNKFNIYENFYFDRLDSSFSKANLILSNEENVKDYLQRKLNGNVFSIPELNLVESNEIGDKFCFLIYITTLNDAGMFLSAIQSFLRCTDFDLAIRFVSNEVDLSSLNFSDYPFDCSEIEREAALLIEEKVIVDFYKGYCQFYCKNDNALAEIEEDRTAWESRFSNNIKSLELALYNVLLNEEFRDEFDKSLNIFFEALSMSGNYMTHDKSIAYGKDKFLKIFKKKAKAFTKNDFVRSARSIEQLYKNEKGFIYIDVTELVKIDAKTGIQRVVNSIINNFPTASIENTCLVKYNDCGWYECAEEFQKERWGEVNYKGVITPNKFDKFVGLDLYLGHVKRRELIFKSWLARGTQISFVIYDMLPITLPDCFTEDMVKFFKEWIDMVSCVADRVLCISEAVKQEVIQYFLNADNVKQRNYPKYIDFFHLGADFIKSNNREVVREKNTFLMVGTIEPRKGHAQIVDSFLLLLDKIPDCQLIIVGKPGWGADDIIDRLDKLNRSSKNIRWLNQASDHELQNLYSSSTALIAASYGEGFGLPLIEAAHYSLPIIARDLPVFKEVAGVGAYYFDGASAKTVADSIFEWTRLKDNNCIPTTTHINWLSWKESSEIFFEKLSLRI
ncbi:glycosyltransferase family 4 protein [Marinomonas epiphytica]